MHSVVANSSLAGSHEHVIQGRWTSFLKKLIPQSAGMP